MCESIQLQQRERRVRVPSRNTLCTKPYRLTADDRFGQVACFALVEYFGLR
jgi:hypothetical protein